MIGETGLSKLPDLPESSVKVWTISNVWSSGKSKVRRNPDIYIFVNLAVPFFFYLTVYLLVRHFPHSLSTNLKHAKKNPVLVLTLVLGAAVLLIFMFLCSLNGCSQNLLLTRIPPPQKKTLKSQYSNNKEFV